jgi:hypothetical protein
MYVQWKIVVDDTYPGFDGLAIWTRLCARVVGKDGLYRFQIECPAGGALIIREHLNLDGSTRLAADKELARPVHAGLPRYRQRCCQKQNSSRRPCPARRPARSQESQLHPHTPVTLPFQHPVYLAGAGCLKSKKPVQKRGKEIRCGITYSRIRSTLVAALPRREFRILFLLHPYVDLTMLMHRRSVEDRWAPQQIACCPTGL